MILTHLKILKKMYLWVKVATEDVIAVSFEGFEALARAQLPYLERLIVTGTDQEARITGPCHVTDAQFVSADGFFKFAIVSAPNLDQLVCRTARQPLTIWTEFDSGHGLCVSGQCEFQRVIRPRRAFAVATVLHPTTTEKIIQNIFILKMCGCGHVVV
jgi:hypothetical protein